MSDSSLPSFEIRGIALRWIHHGWTIATSIESYRLLLDHRYRTCFIYICSRHRDSEDVRSEYIHYITYSGFSLVQRTLAPRGDNYRTSITHSPQEDERQQPHIKRPRAVCGEAPAHCSVPAVSQGDRGGVSQCQSKNEIRDFISCLIETTY